MDKTTLSTTRYTKLKNDLNQIIAQARSDLEKANKRILIQAYWEMGRRISKENLPNGTLVEISRELDIDITLLSRSLLFFNQWPRSCPEDTNPDVPAISWGHYRILMKEKDAARRRQILKKMRQENWNRQQLLEEINGEDISQAQTQKHLKPLEPSTNMLFTYSAKIINIVDADTLELMIDLGFDVWKDQRIRLRGINAPEAKTEAGDKATAYVKRRLAGCLPASKKGDRVVVKTSRQIDMYGRFIGDIFYLPSPKGLRQAGKKGETDREKILKEGNYLNAELVEKGHAERY